MAGGGSAVLAVLLLAVALGPPCGCKNACEDVAQAICDRVDDDFAGCPPRGSPGVPEDRVKACERIRSAAASCSGLRERARAADDEDMAACEADLALLRALPRTRNR